MVASAVGTSSGCSVQSLCKTPASVSFAARLRSCVSPLTSSTTWRRVARFQRVVARCTAVQRVCVRRTLIVQMRAAVAVRRLTRMSEGCMRPCRSITEEHGVCASGWWKASSHTILSCLMRNNSRSRAWRAAPCAYCLAYPLPRTPSCAHRPKRRILPPPLRGTPAPRRVPVATPHHAKGLYVAQSTALWALSRTQTRRRTLQRPCACLFCASCVADCEGCVAVPAGGNSFVVL